MTHRTIVLLAAAIGLIVAMVLSLITYVFVYSEKRIENRLSNQQGLLVDIQKDKVVKIDIRLGSLQTTIQKVGQDANQIAIWQILTPLKCPADNVTINSRLGILERLGVLRRLPQTQLQPLVTYGLDPARADWVLTLTDQTKVKIQVGKRSGFDQNLYLLVTANGRDEVTLVSGELESTLVPTLFDLRRKHILTGKIGQVQSVVYRGTETFRIEKDYLFWRLKHPKGQADQRKVTELLHTLFNLQATRFLDSSQEVGPLGLEIDLLGDNAQSLQFGHTTQNQKPVITVRTKDSLAVVSQLEFEKLQAISADIQSQALLCTSIDRVARIKIISDNKMIILEKGPLETWSLIAPIATEANPDQVHTLLQELSHLTENKKVIAVRREENARPATHWYCIVLTDDSAFELSRINFQQTQPTVWQGWIQAQPRRAYHIPTEIFKALPLTLGSLRK